MPTIEDFNAARAELEMLAAARGLIDDATLRQRVGDVMDRVYGDASHTAPEDAPDAASHTAPEDTDAGEDRVDDHPGYITISDLLHSLSVQEEVINKWASTFGRYVAQRRDDLPSGGVVRRVKERPRVGHVVHVYAYPATDHPALSDMWREFAKARHLPAAATVN